MVRCGALGCAVRRDMSATIARHQAESYAAAALRAAFGHSTDAHGAGGHPTRQMQPRNPLL